MGDLLEQIINYIIAGNLATAKDVDIFKDYSPDEPGNCIIVYEYTGSRPAHMTDMSVRSIQIVCRNTKAVNAKSLAWQVYKLLYKEDKFITFGTRKCLIALRNTPVKTGVDEKNRLLWAFNVAITTNFD